MSLAWNTLTDLPRLTCYEEAANREDKTETMWRSPHEQKRLIKPLSSNRRRTDFSVTREWGNIIVHFGSYWWYAGREQRERAKDHTRLITYCPNDVVYLSFSYFDSSKRSFLSRVLPNAPRFHREGGYNVMTDKHGRKFIMPTICQIELAPGFGGYMREVVAYREGKRKQHNDPVVWSDWIPIPKHDQEIESAQSDLLGQTGKSHPLQQLVLKPSRKRMNSVMRNYQDGIKLLKAAVSMQDKIDSRAAREELTELGLQNFHYGTNVAWAESSNLKPIVWMLADRSKSHQLVPFVITQIGSYSKDGMDGQRFVKYYANEIDRLFKDMIRRVHALEIFEHTFLPLGEVKFNRWMRLCAKDFSHLT